MPTPTFSGSSFRLSDDVAFSAQNSAAVAALADGRFVTVYRNVDDAGTLSYVIHNADGSVAQAESQANARDAGFVEQGDVAVAALAGGGFAITWAARDGGDQTIHHRVFGADGRATTGDVQSNTDVTAGWAYRPDVVGDGDGGFYLVWDDNGRDGDPGPGVTSTHTVRMRHFDEAGRPTGATRQVSDPVGGDRDAAIDVGAGGRVHVVWDDDLSQSFDAPNRDSIRGFEIGGRGPYRADGGDFHEFHTDPDVAYAGGGRDFMVVWNEFVSPGVYAVHGAINGGPEFRINASAHTHYLTTPKVVGLESGGFLVVWNDGGFRGNDDVLGQLLDADGKRIGGEFVVSDRPADLIGRIEATELVDGRVVVTWDASDGSTEVYSRIVDPRQGPATWSGTALDEQVAGTRFADALKGGAGDDTLEGAGGGDRLVGGAGSDTASHALSDKGVTASLAKPGENGGDARGDRYVSIENLAGSGRADALTGNAKANGLAGADGDDGLSGLGGADRLAGGRGNDVLTGGGGADAFVFDTALDGRRNVDTITDFGRGDTLRLDRDVFAALTRDGKLSPGAFAANAEGVAEDVHDRIVYDTDSGRLVYDANGSRAGGATLFAELEPGLALTASDFFLI